MLKLVGVGKVYRNMDVVTRALHGINLDVKEGEFLTIMGPSGSGKTTLLNILGLIETPSEGEYTLFDRATSALNERQLSNLRKSKIGYIFQNYNLINEMTVYENIEFPLLYNRQHGKNIRRRVLEVLDLIRMTHRRKAYPKLLSGGQRQRIAIARALVASPRILLADEPTGHMDIPGSKEIMDILCALRREGITMVMATHKEFCAQYFPRIEYLEAGTLTDRYIPG